MIVVGLATLAADLRSQVLADALRTRLDLDRASGQVLEAVLDVETGQRGYLLTRSPEYLQPYRAGVRRVEGALAEFWRAANGIGVTGSLTSELDESVRERIAVADETIDLGLVHRFDEATDLVRSNRGKVLMDRIRALLNEVRSSNDRAIGVGRGERRQLVLATRAIVLVGSVLVFAILAALAAAIRRDVEISEQHRTLVADQAKQLVAHNEQLLEQKTSIERSRGELEALTTRLLTIGRAREHTVRELERRNADLDQFAYVTSHDLKAPLRGISNLATWIEEDIGEGATATTREQLGLLRGRVQRMENLIEGILTYSRAGRAATAIAEVPVAEIVERLREDLDADDEVTISSELPTVTTDRVQLRQVIQNLITNARRHGVRPGEKPAVEVSSPAHDDPNFVEIVVRDRGPGIAPRYHEKIFAIFQTLAPRDAVESTGIGLAVVRKIVLVHGGRVWVESNEGEGAAFHFTWPRVPMASVESDGPESGTRSKVETASASAET